MHHTPFPTMKPEAALCCILLAATAQAALIQPRDVADGHDWHNLPLHSQISSGIAGAQASGNFRGYGVQHVIVRFNCDP